MRRLQSVHPKSLHSLMAFHVPGAGRFQLVEDYRRKCQYDKILPLHLSEHSVTSSRRLRGERWWSAGRKVTTGRVIADQKDRVDREMCKAEERLSQAGQTRVSPGCVLLIPSLRVKLRPYEGTYSIPN